MEGETRPSAPPAPLSPPQRRYPILHKREVSFGASRVIYSPEQHDEEEEGVSREASPVVSPSYEMSARDLSDLGVSMVPDPPPRPTPYTFHRSVCSQTYKPTHRNTPVIPPRPKSLDLSNIRNLFCSTPRRSARSHSTGEGTARSHAHRARMHEYREGKYCVLEEKDRPLKSRTKNIKRTSRYQLKEQLIGNRFD